MQVLEGLEFVVDSYKNGFTRERVTKFALTASVIGLSVVFPVVGGLVAIGYFYLDDLGVVDRTIQQSWKKFDQAIDQMKYETSKRIYDLKEGLKKGWRP